MNRNGIVSADAPEEGGLLPSIPAEDAKITGQKNAKRRNTGVQRGASRRRIRYFVGKTNAQSEAHLEREVASEAEGLVWRSRPTAVCSCSANSR